MLFLLFTPAVTSPSTNVSYNSIQQDANAVPVNIFANSPPNDIFSESWPLFLRQPPPSHHGGHLIVSSPISGTISSSTPHHH